MGDMLRNELGGTNMNLTVKTVEGNVHYDTWTADNGSGSCKATWQKINSEWKMISDEITFVPKGPTTTPKDDGTTTTPKDDGTTTTLKDVDCEVGDWTAWGECSANCSSGTKRRSREVVQEPVSGGSA